MTQVYLQDPDATLKWTFDWSSYLASGETISTSAWSVEPDDSGIGLQVGSDSKTTTTTTVSLSGGVRGETYRVTNRIVTTNDNTEDRTIEVRVGER